ncbi:MAG: DUF4270 family protein [Bacteroidales bacterium]|nr:DUF4270 family protein [Bacteroidales bacterium]
MKIAVRLALFFALAGMIFACGKQPDTIGLDLVGTNIPFVGNDTLVEVEVYSVLEDSVISDETTVNVIGSMQTATFGLTNASAYTHLRISDPNPVWGPNPVADSIMLYMVYDTSYGNLNTQQTFTVYRVTEDFFIENDYYSDINSLTYNETPVLAQYTFVPDLTPILVTDSTDDGIDSSYLAAVLTIPIENWFAEYIFNLDSDSLSSNEDFIYAFKGIYIRPDNVNGIGEGSLLSFDLVSERSYLNIYYHNDTTDSLNYKFLINLNCARIGKYEHDYELSTDQTFKEQVLHGNRELSSEKLYLQGLGGVQTFIRFPGLEAMRANPNRIINEAKLIFQSVNYEENFQPPSLLYLFEFDIIEDTIRLSTLIDQSEGSDFFGGSLNNNDNGYWFRVSYEAQKIVNGDSISDLVLYPAAKSVRPHELVMPGTNPDNPGYFRMKVIYTDPQR